MTDIKDKVLYCLALVVLLFIGIGFGYIKTASFGDIKIKNSSVLEFAKNYSLSPSKELVITASTKTYDITIVYEDYYSVCKESINTSKTEYGTTMDKVKEQEKKYQEEKGLVYTIKSESENKIVYTRTINENCPNHFKVILENNKINVYSIQGENKSIIYMTIDDVNVENLRDELKQMVKRGTYINSREELNRFIEDLES
ncbi:MAG: hypothetical protein ACI4ON_03285 [Clostridia bacterium]